MSAADVLIDARACPELGAWAALALEQQQQRQLAQHYQAQQQHHHHQAFQPCTWPLAPASQQPATRPMLEKRPLESSSNEWHDDDFENNSTKRARDGFSTGI